MSEKLIEQVVSDTLRKHINETSRRQKAIKNFLGVNSKLRTFGIITAENPMGKGLPKQDNAERNAILINLLKSRQYIFCPVKGKYGNVEHSFMIYNVSLQDLKEIGNGFGQQSFIYAEIDRSKGQPHVLFHYFQRRNPRGDYHYEETKDVYTPIDSEAGDFFTAIGRNFKFSIPFDIFNEAVQKYDDFINERCEKHEAYKASCDRLISESIEDGRTGMSRRICRARLYGTHYENFLTNKQFKPLYP